MYMITVAVILSRRNGRPDNFVSIQRPLKVDSDVISGMAMIEHGLDVHAIFGASRSKQTILK